ncbi:helix-turn-helix transcriptional regulator [Psychrobacillus psychrodurans]|uniref:helix-turn-helix transcriptional regulator n=1 Tax=Psychrobacillus psychrodurans TaxID=126157 RepID=UPI0008EF724B|nr:helix-turn-helix transcriptional regulator [Psychrobacillus psychrodurans]MCZ8541992.1 helix-turn-helix domain-containing protein [Psychrobacillus psychrodurans]SFN13562.1 Cro/C1-type HTH DNA-binding domain-containing protein [Psychrobacillus psychrodurans]
MNRDSFKKLQLFLVEKNIKQKELAEKVGIPAVSLNQKIHRNGSSFTLEEASRICEYLDLSLDEYFFVENVPISEQKEI